MTLTAENLIGAWRLVSAVEVYTDGERNPEFGDNADGYLSYSPNGIVSATLGDMNRPGSTAGDPQSATDQELAQMSRRFIAYAGPYTVDPDKGTVTHHVDVALFTGWEGSDQVRHAHVDAGVLHIVGSPRTAADGREFSTELTWERVSPLVHG